MHEANLDWKMYESITKYIYENLGRQESVIVKGHGRDCKVIGKSGVPRMRGFSFAPFAFGSGVIRAFTPIKYS